MLLLYASNRINAVFSKNKIKIKFTLKLAFVKKKLPFRFDKEKKIPVHSISIHEIRKLCRYNRKAVSKSKEALSDKISLTTTFHVADHLDKDRRGTRLGNLLTFTNPPRIHQFCRSRCRNRRYLTRR
jgi:hypothetical protein